MERQGRKGAESEMLPGFWQERRDHILTSWPYSFSSPAPLALPTEVGKVKATCSAPPRPSTHLAVSLFQVLSLYIPGSGQVAPGLARLC